MMYAKAIPTLFLVHCTGAAHLRYPPTGQAEESNEPVFEHDFRIVGGTNAPSGKYPYMVMAGGCGGSLIAPDMVLSAAHCVGAVGGQLRIGSIDRFSGGETANVRFKIQHPNYQGNNNDFMVVKLDREVKATPVKLHTNPNTPTTGDALTVIGFGRTSEGGSSTNRLKQVTVPYVNNTQCRSKYGNYIRQDTMLCAGTEKGGKDSCQGDSGGPIMNSAGVQVGVVSFGSGCARPGIPGVYARTSGAISWVNEMICEHSPKYCPGSGNGDGGGDNDGGGGSSGDIQLRVRVTHDKYPKEVSWTVKNPSGQVIMRQNVNDVTQVNAVATQTEKVGPGTYRFRIDDGYGDGICCKQGNGKIEIFADNVKVAEDNGQYGSSKEFSFKVATGGSDGGGASVGYKIDFRYDLYPEEVSWWLKDSNGKTIISRGLNSITTWSYLLRENINLSAGKKYILQLRDGHGDGLTFRDPGWVEIYALVDGKKVRLLFDNGDYGKGRDRTFTVPSDIANRSVDGEGEIRNRDEERAESIFDDEERCVDSEDNEIKVNEEIGNKDCHWLSSNFEHFAYLCEFVSIASSCPKTCGDCSLFK